MSTLVRSAARRSGLLTAGALATVLVATIAGPAATVSAQTDAVTHRTPATITVDGTGRVKVTPDVADITLGVRIQKERAGQAAWVTIIAALVLFALSIAGFIHAFASKKADDVVLAVEHHREPVSV